MINQYFGNDSFELFVGRSWENGWRNYHLLKEDKSLCGLEGQFVNVKKLDWLTEGLVSCEKCKETLKFMREL